MKTSKLFIKICGITNIGDAVVACESGASAIGCVLYSESKRCISLDAMDLIFSYVKSRYPKVLRTAVTVNANMQLLKTLIGIDINVVQLHGDEDAQYVKKLEDIIGSSRNRKIEIWKAISIEQAKHVEIFNDCRIIKYVLDSVDNGRFGGTGKVLDWSAAADFIKNTKKPVLLSGGITPFNVKEALNKAKAFGVDLSSGVEEKPGKKDPKLIAELFISIENVNC
jgi:phosphoribosylanthranilate isomerase